MKTNKSDYFVYQNWDKETLFSKNLTEGEANEAFDQLNHLIESGCCGSGCATIGRISDPSDLYVCKRLGLL